MGVESGTFTPEQTESRHPELHSSYLEDVDVVVRNWPREQGQSLNHFSDTELQEWCDEWQTVEEENYAVHHVNPHSIEAFLTRVEQLAQSHPDGRLPQVNQQLRRLSALIEQGIIEYAEAAARHKRASNQSVLVSDGEARLKAASNLRSDRHEHLIDALNTFRLSAAEEFPKQELPAGVYAQELRPLMAAATFTKSELSVKGVSREKIGEWALHMDIGLQAERNRELLTKELAQRS